MRIILLLLLLLLIEIGNISARIFLLTGDISIIAVFWLVFVIFHKMATSHVEQESSEYQCISKSFILQEKQAALVLCEVILHRAKPRAAPAVAGL